MSKALESGKSLLDGVLAKLPESLREQAKGIFAAAEATEALTVLGDSALARADYSKNMDALTAAQADLKVREESLTTDYDRLNEWYTGRKTDFEKVDELRRTGKWKDGPIDDGQPPKPGAPALDSSKFIARDDFDKLMNNQQMLAANAMALMGKLIVQHQTRFNEELDAQDLLTDPNLGKQQANGAYYGLQDAYNTKFKDKITERTTRLEQERITKLVNEQLAAERMKNPQLTIPLKTGSSPLDLLEANTEIKPEQYSAQAAAEEYARLVAARST